MKVRRLLDTPCHRNLATRNPRNKFRGVLRFGKPVTRDITGYLNRVTCMDALKLAKRLPDGSVNCIVTSPPYMGLRDYGVPGQLGQDSIQEYVDSLATLFQELWRVLRPDGTLWLNIGDSFANDTKWGGGTSGKHAKRLHGSSGIGRSRTGTGLPSKCLMGIPWRIAFALIDQGWTLRMDNIWHKSNPLSESVKDRPSKAHEYIFLFTKQEHYWYDHAAIQEPQAESSLSRQKRGRSAVHKYVNGAAGQVAHSFSKPVDNNPEREVNTMRNKRSVWDLPTAHTRYDYCLKCKTFYPKGSQVIRQQDTQIKVCLHCGTGANWVNHFAAFPDELAETCIKAGCPPHGIVYDPFLGSGTTALVARSLGRQWAGSELNPAYCELIEKRLEQPRQIDFLGAAL